MAYRRRGRRQPVTGSAPGQSSIPLRHPWRQGDAHSGQIVLEGHSRAGLTAQGQTEPGKAALHHKGLLRLESHLHRHQYHIGIRLDPLQRMLRRNMFFDRNITEQAGLGINVTTRTYSPIVSIDIITARQSPFVETLYQRPVIASSPITCFGGTCMLGVAGVTRSPSGGVTVQWLAGCVLPRPLPLRLAQVPPRHGLLRAQNVRGRR